MPIFTAVAWLIAKIIGDNVLKFIAGKAILVTLFLVVMPIIFNNILCDIITDIFNWVNSNVGTSDFNGAMNITGLSAYFVQQFKISECISVLVSAYVCKVTLKHIPFLNF